jgi:hypothetical protein
MNANHSCTPPVLRCRDAGLNRAWQPGGKPGSVQQAIVADEGRGRQGQNGAAPRVSIPFVGNAVAFPVLPDAPASLAPHWPPFVGDVNAAQQLRGINHNLHSPRKT